ncbi:MAG: general secretion pathway protein GspE [Myxococcaceae bacterium]|nr:general secretion pathway protein GspE [Myxococcaceae bacterium]
MKRRPIGDILLEMGAIDEYQLQSALAHHRQWGMPLGKAILEKRFATSAQVLAALSRQTMMPVVDLSSAKLDRSLAALLPKKVAEQHRAIPLRLEGARQEVLVVAIAAPASLDSLDAIRAATGGKRLQALLADDASIERAFGIIYLGYDQAETRPVQARSPAILLDENEFELEPEDATPTPPPAPAPAPEQPAIAAGPKPVLIYGWNDQAARTLAVILSAEGIASRVATAEEVRAAAPAQVIVAPLPAIEAIVAPGTRARGRVIVAGKVPERDLPRAQQIGALGFITAPVDTGLLLRSVKRCQALPDSSIQAA